MNPDLFQADLAQKPIYLRELAGSLEDLALPELPRTGTTYLIGMGSSHYAAQVVAARLRQEGRPAHAELASTDLLPRLRHGDLVFAVSASGGSLETIAAVTRLRDQDVHVRFVAVTNRPGSELERICDATVSVLAGPEDGGVACRSFQHTLGALLTLTTNFDPGAIARASEASQDILDSAAEWLPRVRELTIARDGTWLAAPARRLSSAMQSALMLREGPRLRATGCETGDWSHVDVYLTKTLDYRLLLFGGSRWDAQMMQWLEQRGSTVVAVGPATPSPAILTSVRYRHDEDDDVRLLSETLVAELTAAEIWTEAAGAGR